jgi:hypothetical protein
MKSKIESMEYDWDVSENELIDAACTEDKSSDEDTNEAHAPTTFEAAIKYLGAGLCVLPIRNECKRPAVKWKHLQERLPTEDELCKWFNDWGYTNLAVVTGEISGIFVVDCDSTEAYERLRDKYDIGSTPIVKTQDGFHLMFGYTESCSDIRNQARILPDIDIRTNGGYSVLPPSRHEDGKCNYEWVNEFDRSKLLPLPEGLLNEIKVTIKEKKTKETYNNSIYPTVPRTKTDENTSYGEQVLQREADVITTTSEGERNQQLYNSALKIGSLIAGGEINDEGAYERLFIAGLTCGLDNSECASTIESGFNNGYKSPRRAPNPKLQLPCKGRTISEFALELGEILKCKKLYKRSEKPCFVKDGKVEFLTPESFRTWIEQYVICGQKGGNNDEEEYFSKRTISKETAGATISSVQFLDQLSEIKAIHKVQQPIIRESGSLELLPVGFDELTGAYTCADESYDLEMPFDDAVGIIENFFSEFPFSNDTAKAVAVAAMFSVYGLNLLPPGTQKPAFFYLANAEGAGKTLLMKCAITPTCGLPALRSAPRDDTEMRKELITCALEAKNIICFDNLKEHINFGSLESFITTNNPTGRLLGTNKNIECETNCYVFMTGNNCTVSSDLRRRSLFCELHMREEYAESRGIKNWFDDNKLLEKRGELLSAMWAIIKYWDISGRPKTRQDHRTFYSWTQIIGGIVEVAGLQCPVERFELENGGDIIHDDMKRLVDVIRKLEPKDSGFDFQELIGLCRTNDIFTEILCDNNVRDGYAKNIYSGPVTPRTKSALGKQLKKYNDRRFNFPLEGIWEFKITGSGRSRRYFVNRI